MKLLNFNSIYPLIDVYYGVDVNSEDFEDIALSGWNKLNNKHTRLYRYKADSENSELKLPCNVDTIEAVTLPIVDAQVSSSSNVYTIDNIAIENHIERWKSFEDPYYNSGKLIKYDEGDNTLYFKKNYKDITVLYKGILVDEDELPMITEKERDAIAAYVAYMVLYKDGIKKRDRDSLELARALKNDWLRLCNAARIPEHLSQNDMNMVLDAKFRWDRKSFGKSFRSIV